MSKFSKISWLYRRGRYSPSHYEFLTTLPCVFRSVKSLLSRQLLLYVLLHYMLLYSIFFLYSTTLYASVFYIVFMFYYIICFCILYFFESSKNLALLKLSFGLRSRFFIGVLINALDDSSLNISILSKSLIITGIPRSFQISRLWKSGWQITTFLS